MKRWARRLFNFAAAISLLLVHLKRGVARDLKKTAWSIHPMVRRC